MRCLVVCLLAILAAVGATCRLYAEQPVPNSQDLYQIPADLTVPPVVSQQPAAGRRVRSTTTGWDLTSVYHALYLPADWTLGGNYPVIVEFPGNGGYRRGPDVSHGTPEGCSIGYGLSGGAGAIWVCLPFVDTGQGRIQNSTAWWGDIEETKRYCRDTVRDVCQRFGGDRNRVMLAGFSRGAIGCNYVGLHDDEMAKLWCGFFCHSHYDGVREDWPYSAADRASARKRLERLRGRPQWISHEGSVEMTRRYIESTEIEGRFTFVAIPFPNHTDQWLLRDLPVRQLAREWFRATVAD